MLKLIVLCMFLYFLNQHVLLQQVLAVYFDFHVIYMHFFWTQTKNFFVMEYYHQPHAAWKVSVFGVILVCVFSHSDQNNSKYGQFLRSVNVVRKNKVVALYFWNLPLSTYAKTSEKLRKCAYHRVRKVSFSKNFAHAQSSHSITFFFKCTYIKWTGTSNKID